MRIVKIVLGAAFGLATFCYLVQFLKVAMTAGFSARGAAEIGAAAAALCIGAVLTIWCFQSAIPKRMREPDEGSTNDGREASRRSEFDPAQLRRAPGAPREVALQTTDRVVRADPVAPQAPRKMLDFYCRDCDTAFNSAPDGTGYDQACCPTCQNVCMTVQFEREEQARHRAEADFLSLVGQLTHAFELHVPDRQPLEGPGPQLVVIANYPTDGEAEKAARALDEAGIEATLTRNMHGSANRAAADCPTGVAIRVAVADAERARAILEERPKSVGAERPRKVPVEDVSFNCEE